MTAGHTFYRPIAEIDKPAFKHLKDGRPVLVLEAGEPIVGMYDAYTSPPGFWTRRTARISATHFSTHDPRPIEVTND